MRNSLFITKDFAIPFHAIAKITFLPGGSKITLLSTSDDEYPQEEELDAHDTKRLRSFLDQFTSPDSYPKG